MPITADRKLVKRLLSKHGEDAARRLIDLHMADTLGQSDICRQRLAIFNEVYALMDEIIQEENCFSLKDLAVNGHDMMTLGFQGPSITVFFSLSSMTFAAVRLSRSTTK